MICFIFARSLQERILWEVQPVCPQQAALVLSVVVGVLHECSDNGLMTFCSNKFSGSDVSSILLWRELVLISPKCSFFFSLSRDFCSSERKYFSPYLPGPHSLYALNPSNWIVNSTANWFFSFTVKWKCINHHRCWTNFILFFTTPNKQRFWKQRFNLA